VPELVALVAFLDFWSELGRSRLQEGIIKKLTANGSRYSTGAGDIPAGGLGWGSAPSAAACQSHASHGLRAKEDQGVVGHVM